MAGQRAKVTLTIDTQELEDALARAHSRNEPRLWVNEDRTVFVRQWPTGTMEVATRDHSSHTWGPPIICELEA